MTGILSIKNGKRIALIGVVVTALGFVGLLVNVFNVYGKASSCISANAPNACSASTSILVAHVGAVIFWAGLAMTALGVIILAVGSAQQRGSKS